MSTKFIKYLDKRKIRYTIDEEGFIHIAGTLSVFKGRKLVAENLASVSGCINVYENATLIAPQLTLSRAVYVYKNASFTADSLLEVPSGIHIYDEAIFNANALIKTSGLELHNKSVTSLASLSYTTSLLINGHVEIRAPKMLGVFSIIGYGNEKGVSSIMTRNFQ